MTKDKCPQCGRTSRKHYEGCELDPYIIYMNKIGATSLGNLPAGECIKVILAQLNILL